MDFGGRGGAAGAMGNHAGAGVDVMSWYVVFV